ncbi:MAG: DNA cytosine methyltransferase [Acidobacteriota bacterium]|nr:DNA cytosine methyltransferase [Acidobacteriota bacterium]
MMISFPLHHLAAFQHTAPEHNATSVHQREGGLPSTKTVTHNGTGRGSSTEPRRISVVDFFSGCGGTSAGLRSAGMDIVAGIDIDYEAARTFQQNFPESRFIHADITKLRTAALRPIVDGHDPLLFSACAPCQPFSKQRRGRSAADTRVPLLLEFVRFVKHYKPAYVFVENVPGLQTLSAEMGPFPEFTRRMEALGYHLDPRVIESCDYGVPQRRRRLVIIGSRGVPVAFPQPTHGPGTKRPTYSTVWDWIGDLPPIAAGETHPSIPNHRASGLSPLNQQRVRATPEGGGREHWPKRLLLRCHHDDYDGHTDVYGRMRRDAPASGLTTRCISLSNGRFGHPIQDRAISVREAACLQTFPRTFTFEGSLNSMARQIGNAVPVLLAREFGRAFVRHFRRHADEISA